MTEKHQKARHNTDISLVPVIANNAKSQFQNVQHLQTILNHYEQYHVYFERDGIPTPDNYGEWLPFILAYINELAPWFFGVLVDGQLSGVLWAHNWETCGKEYYSVEFSGFAFPGANPRHTIQAIRQLCQLIFEETSIYIIRTISAKGNRAAQFAAKRAGFSHPETMRAWQQRKGEDITGIISSITRSEFFADVQE